MNWKKTWRNVFFIILFLGVFSILVSPIAKAQYWQALPPYNTLWPLWNPILSPPDPVTGFPTPIVNNLRPTTILPVQPCLTWDPSWAYPFLLYNTPLGMAYYEPAQGVNLWPPKYLVDPVTGLPLPIPLPTFYANYNATGADWLLNNVQTANLSFIANYPSFALAANPIVLPPVLTSALPGLDVALINLVQPPPSITTLLNAGDLTY